MSLHEQTVRFYPRKELINTHRGWKEIMPVINQQIETRMKTVEGLACKEGCAHCCYLQVSALPHDVMDVVDYVKYGDHFTREERAEILEKLRAAVDLTEGMDEHQYRAANVACPFLGDDNRCRVYSVRPVSCRAFGSKRVEVCALTVEDDKVSTFRIVPDSLMRLLGTSGLFFVPFLRGCLDWWRGDGLTAPVEDGVPEAVAEVQRLLDRGRVTPFNPFKRINGHNLP